jgi:ABC-2 type transport system ATP-binding protein
MIEAEALCKQFDGFTAVDEVSLHLKKGEVLALLGPNGAGKTTTVRMLSSVLRPTSGTAKIAGYDVTRQAREVRAAVGVLTENHGLYNRMPADDYLDFFGQIYHLNRPGRQERTRQLLEQFGLVEHARRPVGEFSKGMRRAGPGAPCSITLQYCYWTSLRRQWTQRAPVWCAIRFRPTFCRADNHHLHHNLAEADELADLIAIIRRGGLSPRERATL